MARIFFGDIQVGRFVSSTDILLKEELAWFACSGTEAGTESEEGGVGETTRLTNSKTVCLRDCWTTEIPPEKKSNASLS